MAREDTATAAEEPLLPGSIEEYLVSDVPACSTAETAGGVRARMLGRHYDSAVDVAVCDESTTPYRLVGLVPVEHLLAAEDDVPVVALMDFDPPVVAPGLSQTAAAWKAVRRGESSLAVVDAGGRLRGLVPPARLLAVLLTDHDRDLARLGGYLRSTAVARHATEEPLARRLWHRLPWLLVGLLGSAAAAWLVGGFEAQLSADVRLAFFVPGIVYMADAVGTQTETLVIRGLAVGASMPTAFRLETFTGLAMGLLLGVVTLPAVWLALGSAQLAVVVAVSLLAACSVATLVAMTLPWLMHRAGHDPAFGSGPLATVIQDLMSLLIYFGMAVAILS